LLTPPPLSSLYSSLATVSAQQTAHITLLTNPQCPSSTSLVYIANVSASSALLLLYVMSEVMSPNLEEFRLYDAAYEAALEVGYQRARARTAAMHEAAMRALTPWSVRPWLTFTAELILRWLIFNGSKLRRQRLRRELLSWNSRAWERMEKRSKAIGSRGQVLSYESGDGKWY
jgi:hypothetical protein